MKSQEKSPSKKPMDRYHAQDEQNERLSMPVQIEEPPPEGGV
jgi:hypothetical protein